MKRIYAVIEGRKIIRMSEDKKELEEYVASFPEEERKKMRIVEKIDGVGKEKASKLINLSE